MYSESECYDYCIRLHKELQGVNKGDTDRLTSSRVTRKQASSEQCEGHSRVMK